MSLHFQLALCRHRSARVQRAAMITATAALSVLGCASAGTDAHPNVAQRPGVLVAVFAHPDDEIVAAPALARYAAEGHAVHLLTLTSGQVGGSRTDIPEGDELGLAREEECRCSAQALGIAEPILPGFMDGDVAPRDGLPAIRARVRQELRPLQPDVVITSGPDGLTGHTDHPIASVLATEVFQESWQGLSAPSKVYYAAIPARTGDPPAETSGDWGTLSPELITTIIDADDYLEQTQAAMHCHKTQLNPPEAVDQMFEDVQRVLGGKVYFRLALSRVGAARGTETDLLERIDR